MSAPRLLLVLPLLLVAVCGVRAKVGDSEIGQRFKNSNPRTDVKPGQFTAVTVATQTTVPHSSLFSTCLAKSRTFVAEFATIEVAEGSEYIRYVPDSLQSSVPVVWDTLAGDHPSILHCAKAAYEGGWHMIMYDGVTCQVVKEPYDIKSTTADCPNEDSEVVYVLSTVVSACPLPRFLVGYGDSTIPICGFVSKDLMTYREAQIFCAGVKPRNELSLFVNKFSTLTVSDVIAKFTKQAYTKINLWVGGEEKFPGVWNGNFADGDWVDGHPPYASSDAPNRAAYMDASSNFKLRATDRGFRAGVLCTTRI